MLQTQHQLHQFGLRKPLEFLPIHRQDESHTGRLGKGLGNYLGPVNQMIFPLLDIAEFALLVGSGYALRRRSDYHKRLMLFATLALLPAPFAHVVGHVPLLKAHGTVVIIPIFLSLVASGIYDLAAFRRIHPVSLWLGLGMFVLDNLSATVIGHSALWTRIADGLIS